MKRILFCKTSFSDEATSATSDLTGGSLVPAAKKSNRIRAMLLRLLVVTFAVSSLYSCKKEESTVRPDIYKGKWKLTSIIVDANDDTLSNESEIPIDTTKLYTIDVRDETAECYHNNGGNITTEKYSWEIRNAGKYTYLVLTANNGQTTTIEVTGVGTSIMVYRGQPVICPMSLGVDQLSGKQHRMWTVYKK